MAEEKKNFQFLNPIRSAGGGAGITPNFPFGAGQIDVNSLKKNIPHFEELAVTFGLGALKKIILKNTLDLASSKTTQNRPQPQFAPETTVSIDEPLKSVGTSMLGFQVYSNLSIRSGSYRDNGENIIAEYGDIRVDAAIFELSKDNNVITTDIQGRENTIIEYISGKSWKINCKGRILTTKRNTYPTTDVVQLINALNSNKSLRVDSWFLNMVGIYNIVILKKTVPQEEGSEEYQKFEFEAMADYPVILRRPK